MKTILVVRHAKAELLAPGQRDFDRPLAPRGREDALRMGRAIRAMKMVPETIVASPALRAKQTAEGLAKAMRFDQPIRWERALYDSGGAAWLAALRQLPPAVEIAMLVAHNPGAAEAAALLAGAAPHFIDLPTAAIAGFESGIAAWKDLIEGEATLRFLLRPKVVEAIG